MTNETAQITADDLASAQQNALDNWLDAHNLRTRIDQFTWEMHRDLTPAEWAEVEEWAQAMLTDGYRVSA